MTRKIYRKKYLLSPIVATVLLLGSCQRGSDSVVQETSNASPTATPAAASAEAASPSPTVTGTPAPTIAQDAVAPPLDITKEATTLPGAAAPRGSTMTNMPGVVTLPYKPTPTPADPFPPRPTPTVVMDAGRIVQDWKAPAEAQSMSNPVAGNPNAAKIGESLYMQRCVDCHGKKGYGNGGMSRGIRKPPTNLASRMVQANTDGELFWKITNGKSPMPANHQRFTDEQRWYIVAFIRTFK